MKNNNIRRGFTMIELIFVIVIIGILAGIAFQKLSATRDDAKLVTDVHNMSVCLTDLASVYTAKGVLENSDACNSVVCYTVTDSDPGNFTVITAENGASYCSDVDNIGGDLASIYRFKGSGVSY